MYIFDNVGCKKVFIYTQIQKKLFDFAAKFCDPHSDVSPMTRAQLSLQRRSRHDTYQWDLSINEQKEGRVTLSVLGGNKSQCRQIWIEFHSCALILCHWDKATLPRSHHQETLFPFSCQRGTPRGVRPDLIGVEFAKSVNIWQPAEDNGLNNCSKSKANPAGSSYIQFCGSVSWSSCFQLAIFVPL